MLRIECYNAYKVLSTVLGTQFTVATSAAIIVVIVLNIIYYSTFRIRGGFIRKSLKLKFQGPYFSLGRSNALYVILYSGFYITVVKDTHPNSSPHCINSRPCRI